MSNLKLVRIDPSFIAETVARTGSEQLLEKENRGFVGLYDEQEGWYIPLRSNLGKHKPPIAYFETPFKTDNPHFKKPGLDFEKSLFIDRESVVDIKNTIPEEQFQFISMNQDLIKNKFEEYVLSLENISTKSKAFSFSTIPLFPEGIEFIKNKNKKNVIQNNQLDLGDSYER